MSENSRDRETSGLKGSRVQGSRCPYCNGRGTIPLGLGSIRACGECGGYGTRWAASGKNFHAHGSGELSPETLAAIEEIVAVVARQMDPSESGPSDSAEPQTTESSPNQKHQNKRAAPLHRDGA